jgi:hypothetical protein
MDYGMIGKIDKAKRYVLNASIKFVSSVTFE